MSIYGIGNSNIPQTPASRPVRDGGNAGRATGAANGAQGLDRTAVPAKAAPATNVAKAAQGLPVEPPPGTDPALWSVLSAEERAFFAKAGAMGPLTYGRMMHEMKAAQLPAARGGRLDVKV